MKNQIFLFLILISIGISSRISTQNSLQSKTIDHLKSKILSTNLVQMTTNSLTNTKAFHRTHGHGNSYIAGIFCFILGLIIFPLTICCLLWNERTIAKDTMFNDVLLGNNVKEFNSQNLGTEVMFDKNVYIYNGTINVFENCKIEGFELEEHIFKQNHITIRNPSNLPENTNNIQNAADGNHIQNIDQTGDQQLNYTQNLNEKNKENDELYPEVNINQADDTKFLACDFAIESFVEKVFDEDHEYQAKNVWEPFKNSGLFSVDDGIYTGTYNFDNKIRLKDHTLMRQAIEEKGSTLSINENLKEQFKNYIQTKPEFKHYNVCYFNDELYLTSNLVPSANLGFVDPNHFAFIKGDLKIKINYLIVKNNEPVTLVGEISYNQEELIYELKEHDTGIKEASFVCFSCSDEENTYKHHYMNLVHYNKSQLIDEYNSKRISQRWLYRLLGMVSLLFSLFFLLYPAVFILKVIPAFAGLRPSLFFLTAFMLSLITFLSILLVSWISARPLYAVLFFIGIIALIALVVMLVKGNPKTEETPKQKRKKGFF